MVVNLKMSNLIYLSLSMWKKVHKWWVWILHGHAGMYEQSETTGQMWCKESITYSSIQVCFEKLHVGVRGLLYTLLSSEN